MKTKKKSIPAGKPLNRIQRMQAICDEVNRKAALTPEQLKAFEGWFTKPVIIAPMPRKATATQPNEDNPKDKNDQSMA